MGLSGPLGAFLRLNVLFFPFFLLGSLGGVGCLTSSGFSALNLLRASLCLLLTILSEKPKTRAWEFRRGLGAHNKGFNKKDNPLQSVPLYVSYVSSHDSVN